MKLPVAFTDKMKKLLGEAEYEELIKALSGERQYGLRVNTLKADVEDFLKVSPFNLEPVPWTYDGFYISGDDAPGRHPYYHAGLYYIQEPSAMLPGHILGAQPGEKVLDLCAAPGGKTVQIAAAMKGSGLLVSNDINAERVKALIKNIELCGVRNAIVLNEMPEKLVHNFEGYFDRILIDAPCSGEGMFRKDETAARSWESFKCERCTQLQEPILHNADRLLKAGGTLVYSTCTFSPEEDEQMIVKFMRQHPGYELVEIPKTAGIEGGRAQWIDGGADREVNSFDADQTIGNASIIEHIRRTARLWPHRVRGEGHFVAKLIKAGGEKAKNSANTGIEAALSYDMLPDSFKAFIKENINQFPEGVYLLKGRNLYHLPETPPKLDSLRVAKFGWFLGTIEDSRFEPSHSMVTALGRSDVKRTADLKAGDNDVNRYLKGETLMLEGEKGLTAVCVDGWTLGWAKQTGDMLKNLYPRGWRRLS
ncbi:MAG: RsmB/NOP family class I SAM-dependent RNA methyltransferase [Clostridiaceae bacterium]